MKKKYFLLMLLLLLTGVKAQNINFIDANFKAKLLEASSSNQIARDLAGVYFKIDSNNDGEIQELEAQQVRDLDIYSSSIFSIEGINSFSNLKNFVIGSIMLNTLTLKGLNNLEFLNCQNSKLVSLNLSEMINLHVLFCDGNQLTVLDVSGLPNLQTLICQANNLTSLNTTGLTNIIGIECDGNYLTSLDLKTNTSLESLVCSINQIASLDLSNNKLLKSLYCNDTKIRTLNLSDKQNLIDIVCHNNLLESLNLQNGNNSNFNNFNFANNPNLACIQVDNVDYSNTNWTDKKDVGTSFSLACSLPLQYTLIPDVNFETKLIDLGIDSGTVDGKVLTSKINKITTLNISFSNISDLTGIQYFTDLKELNCDNNQLISIDLTKNISLIKLECDTNKIVTLNLTKNINLEELQCNQNQLTSLDVSQNVLLKILYCFENQITSLDLKKNTILWDLYCSKNQLTSLDLTSNTTILSLYCSNNKLTNINLSSLKDLVVLVCNANELNSLDVTNNSNIDLLYCNNNSLENLKLTELIKLKKLNCQNNQLKSLNLQNGNNANITTLNIIDNPNLSCIQVDDVNYSNTNWTDKKDVGTSFSLACSLPLQYTLIPDVNFETKLIDLGIDSGTVDGKVLTSKINTVKSLYIPNSNITDLTGIQDFSDLDKLNCSNNLLTSLDLSKNIKLTELWSANGNLTSLNLSSNTLLESLYCFESKLVSLDLSNNINLVRLWCWENQLTSLDLTNNTKLEKIDCESNKLSNLDISKQLELKELNCGFNQLGSLDVSKNIKIGILVCNTNQIVDLNVSTLSILSELICGQNLIGSLDVTNNAILKDIWCGYTDIQSLDLSNQKEIVAVTVSNCPKLQFINLKNGKIEDLVLHETDLEDLGLEKNNLSNCPNLKYICGDDSQLEALSLKIASYNYANCVVGNYCSFTPGSNFYTIKGTNRIDNDKNGCDAQDLNAPSMKFTLSDGTKTASFITDTAGDYSIPILDGVQTLRPVLENPDYFSVFPTTVAIDFPTQTSPIIQDFCITPNGSHPDLEVKLLPLESARPGFDVRYKILYKNKGNVTQTGTVSLNFDDAVLDLVTASPIQSSQTPNSLVWNITDLKPFETKEILFTLNVNSPMETPAVNNGDLLKYKVAINTGQTDETPNDNAFSLNQEVVGSFDPNDKTCLEGNIITPSLIGEYVNYIIRFENTGNYPAQNIVVKDLIDLAKFDINSLVPIGASHSFVTKISEGNKVEFIFENINLPFEDISNNGYIAFKIKTLPSLVLGDSFANEANIYFDYNFPMRTNKATSIFKTLGTSEFELTQYFNVYPNPTKSILNIDAKNSIQVHSIAVYDILGQLLIAIPNANNTTKVDVSNLTSGKYFIKINSDKGSSSTKFIKN